MWISKFEYDRLKEKVEMWEGEFHKAMVDNGNLNIKVQKLKNALSAAYGSSGANASDDGNSFSSQAIKDVQKKAMDEARINGAFKPMERQALKEKFTEAMTRTADENDRLRNDLAQFRRDLGRERNANGILMRIIEDYLRQRDEARRREDDGK